jgi:hypothetical protein
VAERVEGHRIGRIRISPLPTPGSQPSELASPRDRD